MPTAASTLLCPFRGSCIPADLLQLIAEYAPTVAGLLTCRGVSSLWASAVSDAVGYLNGRCWTALDLSGVKGRRCLINHFSTDQSRAIAACAAFVLRRRLESLNFLDCDLRVCMLAEGECNDALMTLQLLGVRLVDTPHTQTPLFRRLTEISCKQCCFKVSGQTLLRSPVLTRLELHCCRGVSAIGMLLRNSTTLRNLALTGSGVRDASIVGLEEIPTLEVLILSGTKVTDVRRLRACRSLQRLDADSTYLNTDGIENLGTIVSLVTVRLCHCNRITSLRGLACQPTQIENLDLAGCHSWITDYSASFVCSFPVLRKLDLSHNFIDDRVLAAVGNLPSLTVLILRCCIIDGVALLQNAAVLLELDLADSDVYSLRGIECVPCLEALSLRGCTFSAKLGSILPRCPAMRHLDLEGTRATTDDLVDLARMSTLETLNLRQCPAIASSIALLSHPALTTVVVSPGAFEGSEMAVLQRTMTVVELESVELACRWP
jgi:hypothetical protein